MIITIPKEIVADVLNAINAKCSSATAELHCEKDNYLLKCNKKEIRLTAGNLVDITEAAAKARTRMIDEDWRYQIDNKWQRQLLSDQQRQLLSDAVEDLHCCIEPILRRWVVPGWDCGGEDDEEDDLPP